MATRKAARPANKALARASIPARRKRASRSLLSGLPVRSIAVLVGVAGLAALGIALANSRRLREDVWQPLQSAVEPQADRVWAETRPWRDHVSRVLSSINADEVRDAIAQRLSQWVDRLH
ncbi:MAG: hypothetical protein WDM91_03120 [Rhizomicrobium sp.]